MNVLFYASQKDREFAIAEAFRRGVLRHGDECRIAPTSDVEGVDPWADVAAIIGVKGYSRLLMETYLRAGKHTIYLDKGYLSGARGPRSKYCRVSIDSFQPLSYFQLQPRPDDRLKELEITLQPTRRGNRIIIAGGSLKYALWHGFPERDGMDPMSAWAYNVICGLKDRTDMPLVYRPKPSWDSARELPHARYSRPPITIDAELKGAYALVTYGSNAAVDALIAGVPTFVLGDGIVKALSRDSLKRIKEPYYPTDQERYQILCDIAYCQFNLKEMETGHMWNIIKTQIPSVPSLLFGDE